jgi:hypothetical protein
MTPSEARAHDDRPDGAGAALFAGAAALAELPLWAQVLAMARLLERAALALQDDWPQTLRALVERAIAAMHDCAREGGGVHRLRDLIDAARIERLAEDATAPARGLLWYAIDALRAADAAQDFPVDATVTHSSLRALQALAADPRLVPLQLRVVLAGDLDLLRHACREADVGRYAALPADVFQRLAPVRALTRVEPAPDAASWR